MFPKINVPILGIMILFMEAHKCVPISILIGLAIWMITNLHQAIFFIGKWCYQLEQQEAKLYCYVINKSLVYDNITNNKTSNAVFIIFWELWCSTNENHYHI
jgi:hypothetical protein